MLKIGNRYCADWKILWVNFLVLASWWAAVLSQSPSSIICLGHCNTACTTCTQNQTYQCGDGTCIPLNRFRNGVIDCKDSTDEDVNCCNGFFKCDTMASGIGKCLSNNLVDDGTVQCIDGSDETVTNDKTCSILTAQAFANSMAVSDYMYKCQTDKYGSKDSKCVKTAWCLDGKFDCPQGDDENPSLFERCKVGKFPCGANADCVSKVNGTFTCTCRQGFSGDGISNCTAAVSISAG